MSMRDELAAKLPKAVERAKTSPKTAIRLFCVECMGGSVREAKTCANNQCFLWPHRGAQWKASK
jgi:hypothetical protein